MVWPVSSSDWLTPLNILKYDWFKNDAIKASRRCDLEINCTIFNQSDCRKHY